MYSIIASAALLATTAVAQSVGQAVVVNGCEYDVYVADVPAEGGGYEEIDKKLQPGDQYTQQWTELSNAQGWSIKLCKDTSLANIMQYEYTFHNDGTIWYDLSDVNGNPWDGDWEITAESASGTCTPKEQAYRFSTDDAYGMQACPQDSVITVTLCSGEGQNNGSAASASSSVAAVTSSEATASSVSTYTTPTASIPATSVFPTTFQHSHTFKQAEVVASTPTSAPSPTTFATLTTSSASAITTSFDGVVVTDVDTEVVTEVVTATAYAKRHAHHPRGHAHA